jgi:hypothetical protein
MRMKPFTNLTTDNINDSTNRGSLSEEFDIEQFFKKSDKENRKDKFSLVDKF